MPSISIFRFLFIVTLLIALAACASSNRQPLETADLILLNAKIYSLDWDDPKANGKPAANSPFRDKQWQPDAEAIAIKDGKIIAVGKRPKVKFGKNNATRVMDLKGATVIPGLIDSHVHIAELGEILERVNLTGIASPAAAIELLQAQSDQLISQQWIIGQGWDEGAWANNYPNKQMLDSVFPNRPVVLRSLHGFAIWANSKALEIAGIDSQTAAPVGGEILRDNDGQATGILLNRATTLLADKIPKPSIAEFANYIRVGMQQMAKDGYVYIHEAGAERLHIDALQQLQTQGELPIRMYAMLSARDQDLVQEWANKGPLTDPAGFLDIRSVKAYYDGALGSRGARLLQDYSDKAGHRGVSGDGYGFDRKIVDQLVDAGFQVGIHAIGDAGNREVLDYFSSQDIKSSAKLRHRVEHAQVLQAEDFTRFKQLKLIASMEPPHAVEDKTWAEQRLGVDRIKGAYAWRTFRRNGIPLTFNSDLPGSDHNIFYGLHAAVTRRDKQLEPSGGWYPEQAVTIEEAIRAYTTWAAYAAFRENTSGKLKANYWADLTVMDIDPFELAGNSPEKILDGKILMTIVNGKVVYEQ